MGVVHLKKVAKLNNKKGVNFSKNKKPVGMNKDQTWEWFGNKGFIDSNKITPREHFQVEGCLQDQPCYIIGAGPSLKEFLSVMPWEWLNGKNTIGINHIIEDYDGLKWLFFLDKRFLERTTYDIDKFKGKVFCQNNIGYRGDSVQFKVNNHKPQKAFAKGLFSGNFSGLSALNLAIIAGANPIYLLGYGNGAIGATDECYHHKSTYTGELKNKDRLEVYKRVYKHYKAFVRYTDRIVHVTNGNDIEAFPNKMTINDFKKEHEKHSIVINSKPKIVHLSFSNDIKVHGDITRGIIKNCYGDHELHKFSNSPPPADLYILEHFLSTNKEVMQFPYKKKAIDIVHTVNCIPRGDFAKIITLTDAWSNVIRKYGIDMSKVRRIYGGINIDDYKYTCPDYDKKVFGRITRWSPGKIPYDWNNTVEYILDNEQDAKCLFYIDVKGDGSRKFLNHERMIYNRNCKIDDFKGRHLKNMSFYVHANGTFKETMSHAVMEAMATGLGVIVLNERPVKEVCGDAGILVQNTDELKETILNFLRDKDLRVEYGKRAKERAKKFHINNTVEKFDEVIKECLK